MHRFFQHFTQLHTVLTRPPCLFFNPNSADSVEAP
jgi:hypothetical protein